MGNALNILKEDPQIGFSVVTATKEHVKYTEEIVSLIAISAKERGTGRGYRTSKEIQEKIEQGKCIISVTNNEEFVGFCYVESYEQGKYFATSALIVSHQFRGMGVAREIKLKAFQLGQKLFPKATPVTITTSDAVMKMNSELGFKAVGFSEITNDPKFWKGCEGCVNFDILTKMNGKNCLCTAMKYESKTKRSLKRI